MYAHLVLAKVGSMAVNPAMERLLASRTAPRDRSVLGPLRASRYDEATKSFSTENRGLRLILEPAGIFSDELCAAIYLAAAAGDAEALAASFAGIAAPAPAEGEGAGEEAPSAAPSAGEATWTLTDPCGGQPLTIAAGHGHVASVAALLAHGAAVDGADGVSGATALHRAAAGGHAEVIAQLIAASADPLRTQAEGRHALHEAASSGHVGIVRTLVAVGGSATLADAHGISPLMAAAAAGHGAVVIALLDAVDGVDESGSAGGEEAAGGDGAEGDAGSEGAVPRVAGAAGRRLLGQIDRNGWSAYQHALVCGHSDVAALLVKAGLKVEATAGSRTDTHLMAAAQELSATTDDRHSPPSQPIRTSPPPAIGMTVEAAGATKWEAAL